MNGRELLTGVARREVNPTLTGGALILVQRFPASFGKDFTTYGTYGRGSA